MNLISHTPNTKELQSVWDNDPLGFHIDTMKIDISSGWTAAQFALATQPQTFWADKNLPDTSIWAWAVANVNLSIRPVNTLMLFNVPCGANDCASMLLASYQKKISMSRMEKVFPYLLKNKDAPNGTTEYFSFVELVIAHQKKEWLIMMGNAPLEEWRHKSTGDTVLHRCVRQGWRVGVETLLELGIIDIPNKDGVSAKELSVLNGLKGWPPEIVKKKVKTASLNNISQPSLF